MIINGTPLAAHLWATGSDEQFCARNSGKRELENWQNL